MMDLRTCLKKSLYVLTAILVISAITLLSCTDTTEQISDGESDTLSGTDDAGMTEDLNYVSELENRDWQGSEFVFLVESDPCFRHFYDVNVEESNGDLLNDAVYARNSAIEDRYNLVISDVKDGGNAPNTFKNSFLAGEDVYNGVWLKVDNHFLSATNGYFTCIFDVPYINTEKLYWDQNVIRDFTMSGKLYGLMGEISTSVDVFTHLFGVNRTVAADYNINVDDIYNTVRDGTWTYDKLEELLKIGIYSDLNGNSERDGLDRYAFGVSPAVFSAMFSSAGEKWITKDENGNLAFNELTDRQASVLQKIIDITSDQYLTLGTWNIGAVEGVPNTYAYVFCDKFINNTVLFVDIDLGIVMDYRKMKDDDFGIVPVPKFEESQPSYSVYAYPFYPLFSIPTTVTGDKLEFSGFVIEALAAESHTTLVPKFYDLAIEGKYTRDEGSVEMLRIVLSSRIYDPIYFYNNFSSFVFDFQAMMQRGKLNIASLHARHVKRINAEIEKITSNMAGG
jgi:hypothetical protein